MFPSPIVEYVVWSRLDNHRSTELILLKGHLLVELFLNERINSISSGEKMVAEEYSFFRKLKYLEKKVASEGEVQLAVLRLAGELNSLRNRLAHEVLFLNGESELADWSERVLEVLPSTKVQRSTQCCELKLDDVVSY